MLTLNSGARSCVNVEADFSLLSCKNFDIDGCNRMGPYALFFEIVVV